MKNVIELLYAINSYEPDIFTNIYYQCILNLIITNSNKYIKKYYEQILDGYSIEDEELDGCDEDGDKYWVYCKNGWYGRSWNLFKAERTAINNFINTVQIYNPILIYDNSKYSNKDKEKFIKWLKFNKINLETKLDVYKLKLQIQL